MNYKKILILIVFALSFSINANALIVLTKENSVCTETEAYQTWKNLSYIERLKTPQPVKCEENYLSSFKNNYSILGSFGDASSSSFDLRTLNYVPSVKNQESTELCWAFATMDTIESNYKISNNSDIDLSEKHLDYNTSYLLDDNNTNPYGFYNRDKSSGGTFFMAGAYLSTGRGPVLESNLPWSTTSSNTSNSTIKNDYYVGETLFYMSDNCQANNNASINNIKQALVSSGIVAAAIYINTNNFSTDYKAYYNNSDSLANHAVSIIGWDDNYAASNFKTTPAGNGAWLVKDSQGTSASFDGYYYISYYDNQVCSYNMFNDNISNTTNDNSYYYDTRGENGFISIGSTMYFKDKFTKKNASEVLKKISLGTYTSGDTYKVYYSANGTLTNASLLGSGTSLGLGYTTINLTNPLTITDDNFYLILEYTSSSDFFPASIIESTDTTNLYYNNNPVSGVSYYSTDGSTWNDTISSSSTLKFYPVLHAFTDTYDYNIKPSPAVKDGNGYDITLTLTNVTLDDISVKVYDSNNNDATTYFTISKISSGYSIIPKDDKLAGNYQVVFSYQEINSKANIILNENIAIKSIQINGLNEVAINGTLDLTASITPYNATNQLVTWKSSDSTYATVTNGVVKGLKAGVVTITVTSSNGITNSKQITVVNPKAIENSSLGTNPPTGNNLTSYILISLLSISIILLSFVNRKQIFKKV